MITYQQGFNEIWKYYVIDKQSHGRDYVKSPIVVLIPSWLEGRFDKRKTLNGQSLIIKGYFQDCKKPEGLAFWQELEDLHDFVCKNQLTVDDFYIEFTKCLIRFAKKHNLKIPAIQ